ncbi:hypothetical protein COMA1_10596 [Candidatus Nitrospira nitrosa]|uniref:Uncharacterized protein n=1 Tax=Candidatus Nitrospira nitrosa TaxID=1742972 RepID=A0A0S4L3V0_9BACT|nr:hypothetical protein COMA1_10596 [Candidatus Nitrospira nitrosa]
MTKLRSLDALIYSKSQLALSGRRLPLVHRRQLERIGAKLTKEPQTEW